MQAKKVIFLGLDGADPMMTWKLISEGKLPNLKKVLEKGTTVDSMLGAHPTITPPNWATLATGSWPGTHGITCFWNHREGNPLDQMDIGFSSKVCRAEYIWNAAARAGKKSIVFNYPTSWPPTETENTIVIDGTGITPNRKALIDNERVYECEYGDFEPEFIPHYQLDGGVHCIVDEEKETKEFEPTRIAFEIAPEGKKAGTKQEQNTVDRAIIPIKEPTGWDDLDISKGLTKEVRLPVNDGEEIRPVLFTSSDGENFDTLTIYSSRRNDRKVLTQVKVGSWSDWIYDTYLINNRETPVAYKLKLLELDAEGNSCIIYTSFVNDLSKLDWYYPREIGEKLVKQIGPVLNQSQSGDHDIRFEVQTQLYDWYSRALHYLMDKHEWDLMYMHCHALDYANHMYQNLIFEEKHPEYQKYYDYLVKYYKLSDAFVGEMIKKVDDETLLVVVSDHGGMSREYKDVPPFGDPHSIGGKLLEDLGYLVIKKEDGRNTIDWSKTRAICQRSGYIYINLKGRDPEGIVDPADYDSLVEEIIDKLYQYRDPISGKRPVNIAIKKSDMPVLGLYGDVVGDIYFLFNSNHTRVHGVQMTTASYKGTSVGCLFMIAGPGVKENFRMERWVRAVDVVPTICHLTGIPMPKHTEGAVLYQLLKGWD